jgi:NADH dehydrogenase FAD-containing subunit
MDKDPRVVIVGGGFGGLNTARGLAKAPVRVTLVDKRNYHLFRPLLYQVATGLLSADEIAPPLRSIFSRQRNVEVVMSEVNGIDTQNRLIQLPQYTLHYDFLVLATGITYNYFGHDGWRQFAPGLESLDDADRIRGKILLPFETAERIAAGGTANREMIEQLLTFVLVGAGTVGVEMASTMAEMMRMALARDFRHIDPASAQIILYEAATRILPTFPEILSSKAHRHLEKLGVRIRTETRVEGVDSEGVVVEGKRVPSKTIIWCAGVVASPAARWLNAETDRFGRVKVNPVSLGFVEGLNNKIRVFQRRAYGLRDEEYLRLKVLTFRAMTASRPNTCPRRARSATQCWRPSLRFLGQPSKPNAPRPAARGMPVHYGRADPCRSCLPPRRSPPSSHCSPYPCV